MMTLTIPIILGFFVRSAESTLSLSMLRASTTKPPLQALRQSISLDAVSHDAFIPPTIQDYKVEEITSEYVPLLQEIADEAAVEKQRKQYSSLSEDDLKINVRMDSIESPIRYLVTPPPSTCEGASGPAAKLLDCVTTFPMFRINGV